MVESQCVEMSILAGDDQKLTLRINELEELITELKKENTEQAKIVEETEAKLVRYENPHTPSSAQRYKKKSESKKSKMRGAPNGHRGKRA